MRSLRRRISSRKNKGSRAISCAPDIFGKQIVKQSLACNKHLHLIKKIPSCIRLTVSCAHLLCVCLSREIFFLNCLQDIPTKLFALWKSRQNLNLNTISLTWLFNFQTCLLFCAPYFCNSILSSRLKTLDFPLYSACFQGPEG